jgi:uncharacterized membrane protein
MAAQQGQATRLSDSLGWFSIGLGVAEVAAPGSLARLIGIQDDTRSRAVLRAYGAREITTGIGILSSDPHPGWLWARVAGDVLDLATLAAALGRENADGTRLSSAMASVAGVLVADLAAARSLRQTNGRPGAKDSRLVWKAFTINRAPEDVAEQWAALNPLPDIVDSIRFDLAPGGQGTEVHVSFRPGWFGRTSAQNVQEQLRRFKQILETGEVSRSAGSSSVLQPARPLRDPEEVFAAIGGRR